MNLRHRISIVLLVCIVSVSLGLFISAELISQSWSNRLESSTLSNNKVLWNKIITSQQDSMESGISAITRDRKIRKLIKTGNKKDLEVEAAPSFRRLSASNVLTIVQLTDLGGNILFSMPESASGKSDKFLIRQVLKEGTSFRGLEKHQGSLVIELAFPILQRGKVIGAGLFMRNLQRALDDFKFNNQSDISVINGDGSLAATTNADLINSFEIDLPQLGQNKYQETAFNDQYYTISITPLFSPDGKALAHLVDLKDHTAAIKATESISNISYIILIIILASVVFLFSWYIRRAFKPVEQAIVTMEKISVGDLSMDIKSGTHDEAGRLLQAMGVMVSSFRDIITRLTSMSQKIGGASTQMQLQADESKAGVDMQLLKTERVATAMNEMNTTINKVAKNAVSAAQTADETNVNALEGQEIMGIATNSIHCLHKDIQNTTETIRELQLETSEIGGVLDVIRGIAEQTNLLALNAAIEAARAGEQGRGFAVVADEVRTLAGRTQQSTADINDMIERLQQGANVTVDSMQNSLNEVQQSVETIVKTDEYLEKITSDIHKINEINLAIASASEKQSSVAEEINRNVIRINSETENSVLRIDKTVTTSEELNKLTIQLSELISRFKV